MQFRCLTAYLEINSPFLEATDTLCNDFLDKRATDKWWFLLGANF